MMATWTVGLASAAIVFSCFGDVRGLILIFCGGYICLQPSVRELKQDLPSDPEFEALLERLLASSWFEREDILSEVAASTTRTFTCQQIAQIVSLIQKSNQ
jgi:hypothetical protein